jgi:hypothetical protein
MAKVYWHGRHQSLSYSSPLGKLHKQGLQHLATLGWRQVSVSDLQDDDAPIVPAFAWTTRKAGDFAASGPGLPLVRPLPQAWTACLDDKVLLARLALADRRLGAVCPRQHIDYAALLNELQGLGGASSESAPRRWFVKHRHGVKGQAVQPMRLPSLLAWLEARVASGNDGSGSGGAADPQFVVQEEVAPPALWEGRKFAIRCHALVAARGRAQPRAWLHRDVIVLPYARPFDAASDDRAVHISQAGKAHPPPSLASLLPSDHPAAEAALWPRLRGLVGGCLSAAAPALFPSAQGGGATTSLRCDASTLYSVLACDVALDAAGTPVLLEVNSHCAIADGTMAAVPTAVYTRLVADVTSLLVLPALREAQGAAPSPAQGAAPSPAPCVQPESGLELRLNKGAELRLNKGAELTKDSTAQGELAIGEEAQVGSPENGFEPLEWVTTTTTGGQHGALGRTSSLERLLRLGNTAPPRCDGAG